MNTVHNVKLEIVENKVNEFCGDKALPYLHVVQSEF